MRETQILPLVVIALVAALVSVVAIVVIGPIEAKAADLTRDGDAVPMGL